MVIVGTVYMYEFNLTGTNGHESSSVSKQEIGRED